MFAVVKFVKEYRAYLMRAPFKLRVDNRALFWLKSYPMDQSYISHWIDRLDGYHMIIEHRMRDKHELLTASVRILSFMRDWGRSGPFRRKSRKDSRFWTKRLIKHYP